MGEMLIGKGGIDSYLVFATYSRHRKPSSGGTILTSPEFSHWSRGL